MGVIVHNAIILSTWQSDASHRLYVWAIANCPRLIFPPKRGETYSAFLPPDGKKEGTPESDEGDNEREALRAYIAANEDDFWSWVEVAYGDCFPRLVGGSFGG